MKNRLATLVLIIGAFTSRSVFADGAWTPGNPKPMPGPDSWLGQLGAFCSDLWSFLVY